MLREPAKLGLVASRFGGPLAGLATTGLAFVLLSPSELGRLLSGLTAVAILSLVLRLGSSQHLLSLAALGRITSVIDCLQAMRPALVLSSMSILVGLGMLAYGVAGVIPVGAVATVAGLHSARGLFSDIQRGFRSFGKATLTDDGLWTWAGSAAVLAAEVGGGGATATAALLYLAVFNGLGVALGFTLLIRSRPYRVTNEGTSGGLQGELVGKRLTALTLVEVSAYALAQLDLLAVAVFLGPVQAGTYGMAQRAALALSVPLVAVSSIHFPDLVRAASDSTATSSQALRPYYRHLRFGLGLAVAGLLVAVSVAAVRPADFLVVLGPRLAAILLLLGLGQVVHVAAGPAALLLAITASPARSLGAAGYAFAVFMAIGLLLGPSIGAVGVATASALAIVTYNIGCLRQLANYGLPGTSVIPRRT